MSVAILIGPEFIRGMSELLYVFHIFGAVYKMSIMKSKGVNVITCTLQKQRIHRM